jgi:hypothetical protein
VRHLRGQFTHINAARGLKAGAVRLTEAADGTIVLATTRAASESCRMRLFVPSGRHPFRSSTGTAEP